MQEIELGDHHPSRTSLPPSDISTAGRPEHSFQQLVPPDLSKGSHKKNQASSLDIVDWDGPDDPEKPTNFSRFKKWLITMSMASLTLTVTFSSSIFSVVVEVTARRFHVSLEIMTLGTALFVLGIGLGPMIWG